MRLSSKISIICIFSFSLIINFTVFWTIYEKTDYVERLSYYEVPVVSNWNRTLNIDVPLSDNSIAKTLDRRRIIYVLNGSRACSKSDNLTLVAVVISRPEHSQRRLDLRNSWTRPLSASNSTAVIFLLGRTNNESIDEGIILENEIYHDLVVVNFDESYRNLSLKTILMLSWVRDFCANARFVLKSDDDMFINVYNLMTFIREDKPDSKSIYGNTVTYINPNRIEGRKWMVTEAEYNETVYPLFVSGASYLIGIDAVSVLVEGCVRLPYLFLEDVFVTGICASRLNVPRVTNRDFTDDVLEDGCSFYDAISGHRAYGNQLRTFHEQASDFTQYEKCLRRIPKAF